MLSSLVACIARTGGCLNYRLRPRNTHRSNGGAEFLRATQAQIHERVWINCRECYHRGQESDGVRLNARKSLLSQAGYPRGSGFDVQCAIRFQPMIADSQLWTKRPNTLRVRLLYVGARRIPSPRRPMTESSKDPQDFELLLPCTRTINSADHLLVSNASWQRLGRFTRRLAPDRVDRIARNPEFEILVAFGTWLP
jgi:hypothetical protein